ncbi:MAG: hypothetical protein M3033_10840 [Acidobacteriota bacterium]|nr:hypothetical protein [Acidobacteriota bacterium]
MSGKVFPIKNRLHISFLFIIFSVLLSAGCAVEAAKTTEEKASEKTAAAAKDAIAQNKITIKADSPADTVRVFYKDLREGKFRDALFLTNLRPAIEGLTDAELKDLQVDFANLAKNIPAEVEINGEIISGSDATVTAKLPDNDTGKIALQEIKLRRAGDVWVISTVDDEAEKVIRREGKNYFFNLKIEVHEREAKKMLERIAKAELVFAAQNGGQYGDVRALVEKGLLPDDALTSDSTGYNYSVMLAADERKYSAHAVPAVYGKTGKLSFGFEVENNRTSSLFSEDTKGQPLNRRGKS